MTGTKCPYKAFADKECRQYNDDEDKNVLHVKLLSKFDIFRSN